MPNLKIYVDRHLFGREGDRLIAHLPDLRTVICQTLSVPANACQLAVIAVDGPADQPALNLEVAILQKPDRTRPVIEDLCRVLQHWLRDLTGQTAAIRITLMPPETYIVHKPA